MRKKVLSVLLCAAMTTCMFTACGNSSGDSKTKDKADKSAATETPAAAPTATPAKNVIAGNADADNAFVIWGWNQDIQKILDGPFKTDNPALYKRIVFVNTGGSDFYQAKIDEILKDESNKLYPDLMGLEVDYVLKYVNSDYLKDVSELGITKKDYSNQYAYNLDLGTDSKGKVKALFWQATPGAWQLRADFCQKYFGTTDPATLQSKYFSTWDNVVAAAELVNKKSGGAVKLLSGYNDVFRCFSNSRTTGWYKDDAITIDSKMTQYLELAKKLYSEQLTFNTDQWSADWNANMEGTGKSTKSRAALAYAGCPWFTYWCLKKAWTGNTILVAGPQKYFWGGTGLAATKGCSDTDMAGKIIKYFTCDKDSMVKINALNSDFVNNKQAIAEIMAKKVTKKTKCPYLYAKANQNFMKFYLPLADGIDASTATAEDQTINDLWSTQVKEYVAGKKDKNTTISDFKKSVHDKYEYLKAE